ncbi:hypothetical protein CP973_06905 [Streptomyces albofaciens JCM 4342]|uniref:hypothetical protein n=1 Tax=Streptomyces albofaciens TaxID=66866 RepID=UPI00123B5FBE|nr:hypothetical protein [Streptomyces albofaciens]KAA6221729.1 hypothetical protein CP973_06905 [Streptomyces albofaciens JCM 4342]
MSATYIPLDRAEVVLCLDRRIPAQPGRPMVRVPADAEVQTGGVAVHRVEGQPGYLYYLLDGCIYEQDAGRLDDLPEQIPGAVLTVVPGDIPPDRPPSTTPDFPWDPPVPPEGDATTTPAE